MRFDKIRQQFVITICTYKRPHLLRLLLVDLLKQSVLPEKFIIIDGDPSSKEIKELLTEFRNTYFVYIPSNHANISYQRYLGWRAAKKIKANILVYLDDDLRIKQNEAIALLLAPFTDNKSLVGTTTSITFPTESGSSEKISKLPNSFIFSKGLNSFSRKRSYLPGSVTPTGARIFPNEFTEEGYGKVKWAYGGVMAFNMKRLGAECFISDSFALHEAGYGLGEDTLISHLAAKNGDIYLVPNVNIIHPNADESKAYSRKPFQFGLSTAYSRRLINDHNYEKSTLNNKLFLIKSYFSNNVLNSIKTLMTLNSYSFLFALGYFVGSVKGLFHKPTAKNLTPKIDWWKDAQEALAKMEIIQ